MSDQSIDFQENAKTGRRQSDASLLENNPEAIFWNKVRTAEHYIYGLLHRALSQACAIQNSNPSPLLAKLELEILP